tara:strand:+ start:152 stop:559 length:408 start_codon:yes stop_codon:yes gene_type:complete
MSKSLLLKAFNNHLFQFLDDIIMFFPENMDLKTSRKYFDTIKNANPTIILKIWHKYIYLPYNEKIEAGDLDFFIEKDYAEDLQKLKNNETILKIINSSLRDPLRLMDEGNMKKCRQHFQLVTRICARYMTDADED